MKTFFLQAFFGAQCERIILWDSTSGGWSSTLLHGKRSHKIEAITARLRRYSSTVTQGSPMGQAAAIAPGPWAHFKPASPRWIRSTFSFTVCLIWRGRQEGIDNWRWHGCQKFQCSYFSAVSVSFPMSWLWKILAPSHPRCPSSTRENNGIVGAPDRPEIES